MNILSEPLINYRKAAEMWPDASTLRGYYDAILSAAEGNGHGVVEHVKSFIECLCVTILTEHNTQLPSSSPSLTELLVEALRTMGLHNTRGASKLDKVLSAFNKLSDAISEMRNENGPVAHGKDAFVDAVTTDHGRAFLYSGGAIVGVLVSAMEGTEPNLLYTREPFEKFLHLTKKIDRAVSLRTSVESDENGYMLNVVLTVAGKAEDEIKLRIEPSRLLYGVDREVFVEVLNEAESIQEVLDVADKTEERKEEEESLGVLTPALPIRSDEKVVSLARYKTDLISFLGAEKIPVEMRAELAEALLDVGEKYMVVDWQVRDSRKSTIKLRSRRIFNKYIGARSEAEELSEKLLKWFMIQIPVEKE